VRDADVMLATLDELERRFPDDVPADAAGALRQALEAHRRVTAADTRELAATIATEILEEARTRVAAWPLDQDGFEAFEDGLRRAYRRGRRDMRIAEAAPTTEHIHEWRKRVKDLWYHLLLLEDGWRPVMRALANEAHELSDRLGDDHDLGVLATWAQEHSPLAFEDVVRRRREELRAEAFALGERLYADRPSTFVNRVACWWRSSAGTARAHAAHH
jgi:CHAD domain-containing protein